MRMGCVRADSPVILNNDVEFHRNGLCREWSENAALSFHFVRKRQTSRKRGVWMVHTIFTFCHQNDLPLFLRRAANCSHSFSTSFFFLSYFLENVAPSLPRMLCVSCYVTANKNETRKKELENWVKKGTCYFVAWNSCIFLPWLTTVERGKGWFVFC